MKGKEDLDGVQPNHGDTPHKKGDSSVKEAIEESPAWNRKPEGLTLKAMSKVKSAEAAEHLTKAILLNNNYLWYK